jgi:hypothetical protein
LRDRSGGAHENARQTASIVAAKGERVLHLLWGHAGFKGVHRLEGKQWLGGDDERRIQAWRRRVASASRGESRCIVGELSLRSNLAGCAANFSKKN